MTILVLGAGGMAGHVVATYLAENGYKVDTLSAKNKLNDKTHLLDVTQTRELKSFLDANKYDAVINCIGLLVKESEEHKDLAVYLNSYLPHYLEKYYQSTKTRVIHLSTDCVFSGKTPPYKDDAPYDGELFYDRSKALGEIKNNKDLTFRMSIVGPDMQPNGSGLFNWFYQQSGTINGFTKAMWNGITTIELAKAIKAALDQNLTGLYQLAPAKNISKFGLLELFKEVFERDDITVQADDRAAPDKTLANGRRDFKFTIPDYKIQVTEMKDWIAAHPNLYKHYAKAQHATN